MEEIQVDDSYLLSLPLELQANIIRWMSIADRVRLAHTCHALAQAVVFVESTEEWVKRVLLPFQQDFTLRSLYAALFSKNSSRIVATLGDSLVELLRNRGNFTSEQTASIEELHAFYQGHGGRASLELMKQKADELNKRQSREKLLDNIINDSGIVACGTCQWGTIGWIGFGCCCSSSPCCCAINITLSVLCGGGYSLHQAAKYEKTHHTLRARFFDIDYDLETHPGNDFSSVVEQRVQMDEEAEQLLQADEDVAVEERPNCFRSVANFFRFSLRIPLEQNRDVELQRDVQFGN